jgi:hypothetical protein
MIWGSNTTTRAQTKLSWAKLQEALKVREAYLKMITENSTAGRHGYREHISGPITSEITRRTWAVMNRYLELRVRVVDELPSEFLIL